MAKRNWKFPFLASFRRAVPGVAESPDQYLRLATKCMEHAQRLNSLKFNQELCIYLAHKLKIVVQSANLFLVRMKSRDNCTASSPPETAKVLELFSLLFSLAKEVESFIECCCKDAWIQAALLLTNVSELISSLGFNLELFAAVFADNKGKAIFIEDVSLFHAEVEIIKRKACVDEENLWMKLDTLIQFSKLNGEEHELATFLRDRSRLIRTPDSHASSQLNFYERDITKLKRMMKLGRGASATVYKATWLGIEVAMKTFHNSDDADFKREVSVLARLCHPNVMSLLFYGVLSHGVDHAAECSIVMEVMEDDLESLMKELVRSNHGPPFTILEAIGILLQIAQGMDYMHNMKIVHRDLKSQNILVKCIKATEVEVCSMQVKVADFGLARTKETSSTNSYQKYKAGTTRWMAPEVIICGNDGNKVKNPFKSDVYSFGMVSYEILTGNVPFFDMRLPVEINRSVLNGVRPELPNRCTQELKILIEDCWNPEPNMRPCFGDICARLRHIQCGLLLACVISSQKGLSGGSGAQGGSGVVYQGNLWDGSFVAIKRSEVFTISEIAYATGNFSLHNKIGQGLFCMVYKGTLRDGRMVAIKRSRNNGDVCDEQWSVKFRTEVEMWSQVDHLNLGNLIGYTEGNERILVAEYVPNGNLREHLAGTYAKVLDMTTRLDIAIGVAQALTYLHLYADRPIIHGDIKSSHILLTDTYRAKVVGFGFSCIGPSTEAVKVMEADVKRRAYLDPEYLNTYQLNTKSDVYSFGILLVEIFTGRGPIELQRPRDERVTVRWAFRKFVEGKVSEVLDPKLERTPAALSIIERMGELTFACAAPTKADRPSMKKVVEVLWEIRKDYLVEHQEVEVKSERLESVR